jgi:AcrR family transcriptional regulator
MGRRTGVTSDETRQELLAATMQVLLARGYQGTRVSEIAKEAGVTSGAIYNHFSSKADLLSAAIAEQGPNVISDLLASGAQGSVLDALRQIASRLPAGTRAMGPLLLELVVTAARDPEVADVVSRGFAEREVGAADVIRLAQAGGEVDPALDAEAVGRFTTMLALGSLVVGSLDLKPIDEGAWAGVTDRMLDAIQPHDPQP